MTAPHDTPPPKVNHLRNLLFALRVVIFVFPALGGGRERENPPPGMSPAHYILAGLICAAALVGCIILIARTVLHFALS